MSQPADDDEDDVPTKPKITSAITSTVMRDSGALASAVAKSINDNPSDTVEIINTLIQDVRSEAQRLAA